MNVSARRTALACLAWSALASIAAAEGTAVDEVLSQSALTGRPILAVIGSPG